MQRYHAHERAVLTACPPARAGRPAGHRPSTIAARTTLRLAFKRRLLCPRKRASPDTTGMSASCRKATYAVQQVLVAFGASYCRRLATHHARELAGDGEAETGAAEALSGRGIGLGPKVQKRSGDDRHRDRDRALAFFRACPRPCAW